MPADAASPADASAPDAATDARADRPTSIVGMWRQCGADLAFHPDGRWEQVFYRERCTARGTWQMRGERFDQRVERSDCARPPVDLEGALPVFQPRRLVIVHEGLGTVATWLSGALPVTRWRITDRTPQERERVTILRVVGDASSATMSGCYWSGDGRCNGVFSCGGTVTQWRTTGASLAAGLSCTGDCTCGTSLYGPVAHDRFEARATASDCQGVWTGEVVGVQVPDVM